MNVEQAATPPAALESGSGLKCKTCGIKQEQLPPNSRFLTASGEMLCNHSFGLPAGTVPNWQTHDLNGVPYDPETHAPVASSYTGIGSAKWK